MSIINGDFILLQSPLTCEALNLLSDKFYDGLRADMEKNPSISTRHFEFRPPEECPFFEEDDKPIDLAIFICSDGKYGAQLAKPILYGGNSRSFEQLASGEIVAFDRWEDFVSFMRSLIEQEDESLLDVSQVADYGKIKIPRNQDEDISFEELSSEVKKRVIGQDEAVDIICYSVVMALKRRNPKKPPSFLLHGVPGVGKSEIVKVIADILSKRGTHRFSTVWTDLNTFTERYSVYRLIGSPPGYVGYDDVPTFEAVAKNPYTIFVQDELDKAHPEVLKVFMALLDEGRCASRKELADGSREFDFRHCIFFFTSNYNIGTTSERKIGFASHSDIEEVDLSDNGVSVSYKASKTVEMPLAQRIYAQNEQARRAFMAKGALKEIASRFGTFVEFKPLDDHAKIRILAKQIIETGFEYDIRLSYIAPGIMQGIVDAATASESLTVRSFVPLISGYLAPVFATTSAMADADTTEYRLEGTLENPVLAAE